MGDSIPARKEAGNLNSHLLKTWKKSAYPDVIRRKCGSIEAGQATASFHYSYCYYGCSSLQKPSCVLCLEGKRLVIIAIIMPESNSLCAAGAEM